MLLVSRLASVAVRTLSFWLFLLWGLFSAWMWWTTHQEPEWASPLVIGSVLLGSFMIYDVYQGMKQYPILPLLWKKKRDDE